MTLAEKFKTILNYRKDNLITKSDIPTKLSELENDINIPISMSDTSINLLEIILQEGVYSSDQTENISLLTSELRKNSIGNEITPQPNTYTITKNLTNCTISNLASSITEGQSYSATVTANSGFENLTVTCKMGGNNVSVANGVINIASVSGNIVITASATAIQTPEEPDEPTAQYINFADPNVKAVLVADSTINTDGDDEISIQEAEKLTALPAKLFANNTEISTFDELALFKNVTNIRDAFQKSSISHLVLPIKVTSIGAYAFQGCSNLKEITLHEGITTIQTFGFYQSGITHLELPSTVTKIAATSMQPASCTYVKIKATIPPTLDNKNAFNGTCIIYVPDTSVDAYKVADVWVDIADRIKPISEMQ